MSLAAKSLPNPPDLQPSTVQSAISLSPLEKFSSMVGRLQNLSLRWKEMNAGESSLNSLRKWKSARRSLESLRAFSER